jgi:ribonucleotide reductase beta subunit family protein with ferritin-like domain
MKTISMRSVVIGGVAAATLAFTAGYAFAVQVHMQNALHALENARSQLQMALADKAGHRVNAINLVNQAINETEAGIAAGM